MTSEIIKRMFDACYQAKRTRDMLPPLPEGVRASFIQYAERLAAGSVGQGGGKRRAFLTVRLPERERFQCAPLCSAHK